MKSITVALLAQHGNVSIVQLPERKFPAITIQGDSFSVLARLAEDIVQRTALANDTELHDDATELKDRLDEIRRAYEAALDAEHIPLPY